MFLGLGGSRRRAQVSASGLLPQQQQQQQQEFLLQPQHQGDPLQALATGKYARFQAMEPGLMMLRSKSCEDPAAAGWSPRSTLNLSRETSRASGDSGVSVHAGEEASSRLEGTRQQSQALALAKKLRNSLGSKFADSLRETIKEVAKREKVDGESCEAWPQLLEDVSGATTSGVSRSGNGVKSWSDACWPVEKDGIVAAQDCTSLLSFSADSTTTRAESLLKGSFGGIARLSKVSSWLPQASWEGRSQAQAIPSLSSSMDSPFFSSGGHPSLLDEGDMSVGGIFKDSSAKGQWMDGFTSSRPPSTRPAAVARRHFFPEAAAMGTSRPDSLLQQTSKPNFPETIGRDRDQSLVDVLKGFQSSGKDCGSFLEFLNPGHPFNQALLDDARRRLYGKSAGADSCQDSVGKISGTDWRGNGSPLEYPENGVLGVDGGVKRTSDGFSSGSVQSSKRQCVGSDSILLDVLSVLDAGCEVKSESEFKDYSANLTARESSYELPGSSLTELMEDLSQDLLLPYVSS